MSRPHRLSKAAQAAAGDEAWEVAADSADVSLACVSGAFSLLLQQSTCWICWAASGVVLASASREGL